jgi:hypothetical protein
MTIDHEILERVTGGDAASDYGADLKQAWDATASRAQRIGPACQRGDWGDALKQTCATTIDGLHLVGTAVSPLGNVVNSALGTTTSKVLK